MTAGPVQGRAEAGGDSGIRDDRLRLMFTCCHPALPLQARVALTLRAPVGLATVGIARAFLVPEQAKAKRPAPLSCREIKSGIDVDAVYIEVHTDDVNGVNIVERPAR